MPVHLAQMKALEKEDSLTWDTFDFCGDFCVRKSDTPFISLFVDQTLEIKKLKGIGGITGLTQHDEILDRFLLTALELSRFVEDFQDRYNRVGGCTKPSKEHYQLSGEIAIRLATNALKLRDCIQLHCEENPYIVDTPLKNVISSMAIPDTAKQDILQRDEKGQSKYETFVGEMILAGSATSIWDPMKKLKLKSHSTWMAKQKDKIR